MVRYRPRVRRTLSVVATAAHVLLAFTPLALVAYVARRLQTDSCNHVGLSPLGVALACLGALVAAGGLRWALWRRLDGLAVSALLPGVFAVAITVPLDRCNLLIGYGTFTARHLPDADLGCCAHVPRMPVCRAAEAARAAAARERSWQLATGIAPPDVAAQRAAAALEAALGDQQRRVDDDAAALARELAERRERQRREDEDRRWGAAMSARLLALRDRGASFLEVGPLAEERRRPPGDAGRPNGCSPKLDPVRVLETPSGWFVPVAPADFDICSYELWFVPRAGAATARPVRSTSVYKEFDLDFTVRMVASDLDDDGTVEAVLVRGWEHVEGVGEGQRVLVVEPTGEPRETPWSGVEDLDGDGRLDALLDFSLTRNGAGCDDQVAWDPEHLGAPTFALRAVGGGRFSLADPVARAHRADLCRDAGPLAAAVRGGQVDESEVARRLLCRLADGEPPEALRAELAAVCLRRWSVPEDCTALRPGTCRFADVMSGWLDELPGLFAGR